MTHSEFDVRPSAMQPRRAVLPAIIRGCAALCPACGKGRLFAAYLKVTPTCGACGQALHHHRADDAPPYFTMLIVGHLVIPLLLLLEVAAQPPTWLHLLIWAPLSLALTLVLLPMVKGAIVALQWAHYMHGFEPGAAQAERLDATEQDRGHGAV
jgi:uncharacterized protein (DUF983 family)